MDYWPYLAEGQKEAGVDLLMQIHALIPKGIPDHLRADMCQELCVAFLSGEFDTAKPDKKVVAKAKRRVYDMHDMVYKTVSIDAPIHPASTTTIADFLAADAMDKWAA